MPTWLGFLVILLALVGVAIPGFQTNCAQRPGANESAAIASLKNIAVAQEQVQLAGWIDRNGDGVGEFGSLPILAGQPFDLPIGPDAIVSSQVEPPMLSAAWLDADRDEFVRSAYRFRMFLPAVGGGFVSASSSESIDPERATREWRCYAWPERPGQSGRRVFVIDQTGQVQSARVIQAVEESVVRDAGIAEDPGDRSRLAVDTVAVDGRRWESVR